MLKIGGFSSLSKVSIKTLRNYDEVGLSSPEEVGTDSGYCYYSVTRLPRLHRILVPRFGQGSAQLKTQVLRSAPAG